MPAMWRVIKKNSFEYLLPINRVEFDELLMKVSSIAGPKESILIGI
jgi:hypothetical protein